ncbi:hypothetical protein [Inquilinus sp. CAU 1745]|uniref:hypothetical protein n=1 Tax=Inquilinus sp. CAU 1745 TaxID=3140369 RepID=UPI00325B44F2
MCLILIDACAGPTAATQEAAAIVPTNKTAMTMMTTPSVCRMRCMPRSAMRLRRRLHAVRLIWCRIDRNSASKSRDIDDLPSDSERPIIDNRR